MNDTMKKEQVTLNVEVPKEAFVLGQALVKLALICHEQIDQVTGEITNMGAIEESLKSELRPALINFAAMGRNEIAEKKVGILGAITLASMDLVERFKL